MKGKSKRARGGDNMVGNWLSHIWSLYHPIRADGRSRSNLQEQEKMGSG